MADRADQHRDEKIKQVLLPPEKDFPEERRVPKDLPSATGSQYTPEVDIPVVPREKLDPWPGAEGNSGGQDAGGRAWSGHGPSAPPESTPEDQRNYLRVVQQEIERLGHEASRYQRRHQRARIGAIIAGAAAPVLAAWSAVPRPILALVGGLAVAIGAATEVFQHQSHAVNMLHTGNALERELTRFLYHVTPYTGPDRFPLFVDRVESIREMGNLASKDAWQRSSAPAVGQAQGAA